MHIVFASGEAIGTNIELGGLELLGKLPFAKRYAIARTTDGMANAAARFTNISRKSREHHAGVANNVRIGILVRPALAKYQISRTVRRVLASDFLDRGSIDSSYTCGPFGGVVRLILFQIRKSGRRLHAIDIEFAFKRGGQNRRRIRNGFANRRIPYHEIAWINWFTGFFVNAPLFALAQHLASFSIHQKRQRSMLEHEFFVVQLIVKDICRHAEVKRRIASRLNGNPLVSFARRGRKMRIKHDNLAPCLLGIHEGIRLHHGSLQQVRTGDNQGLRIHPIARFRRTATKNVAANGRRFAIARSAVNARLNASRAAQKRRQERKTRLIRGGHVYGRLTVFIPRFIQLLANRSKGLIPRNRLELIASTLANTTHRRLKALVGIHVLNLRDALHAYMAIIFVNCIIGLNHGQTTIANRALQ